MKKNELELNIEDQVNRNSRDTLVIRGLERKIKRKHGVIPHMYSLVFFVGCLDGILINFLVTLKEHTQVTTNALIDLSR